jgi:hypothetical protein
MPTFANAIALFAAEGWQTYTADPDRTYRALTAPGSTILVALDAQNVPNPSPPFA